MYAQIAQSVEQRTENPRVTGSIPVLGTFKENLYGSLFFCAYRFSDTYKLLSWRNYEKFFR